MKLIIIFLEFIPIILIILYYLFKYHFIKYSHNILGKLFGILLIIMYSYINRFIGVIFALFFILYYQSDLIENFYNLNNMGVSHNNNIKIESFEDYQKIYENKQEEIINKKIIVENELLIPKNSNKIDKNTIIPCKNNNTILNGSVGVISESFSNFT